MACIFATSLLVERSGQSFAKLQCIAVAHKTRETERIVPTIHLIQYQQKIATASEHKTSFEPP